jgi:hypothetical protein
VPSLLGEPYGSNAWPLVEPQEAGIVSIARQELVRGEGDLESLRSKHAELAPLFLLYFFSYDYFFYEYRSQYPPTLFPLSHKRFKQRSLAEHSVESERPYRKHG